MNRTLTMTFAAALLILPLTGCSDAFTDDQTSDTSSELRGRDVQRTAERAPERTPSRVDATRDLTRPDAERTPTRDLDRVREIHHRRLAAQCSSDCTSRARHLYGKCLDRADERTCIEVAHEAARECVADFCGR